MIPEPGFAETDPVASSIARPEDPAGRILLLACGALAREILALKAANGWTHLDLVCLPASLHLVPSRIPDAVRDKVREARARGYRDIKVVYADCGTGGLLDAACEELGVERIPGPHCYSFFEGNDAFAARTDEIAAFYLTDFLVRQFEAFVWKPMGLDRHPELRDTLFGNYEKLVYLSQIDDPDLVAQAREAADRLGLAFEHRHTGYGDLESFLRAAGTRTGIMFILSSPSGAGKSTLSRRLLESDPAIRLSISATTRPKRPGEVEGTHYFFVEREEFSRMVAAGEMLEHASVFGNLYGTPRAPVKAALENGCDVLFDVDWQGAQQLGASDLGRIVKVFILPPSLSELERRLKKRAEDSAEIIARRMTGAGDEISHWAEYDYVLINDDLDRCFSEMKTIVAAERLRSAGRKRSAERVDALSRELGGLAG